MEKSAAKLQQLSEQVWVIVGADGATNFGIVKGKDDAALLIDADIRRMDEIDEALKRTACGRVRYLLNTHENFDHSSANDYFERNGAVVLGSDGCQDALKSDGEAKFAEMAGRAPELKTRFPGLKMGLLQVTFSQSLTLHLPGVDVRVLYSAHNGKSHSRGDSIAVLEREGILFTGDLLYTDFHPVTVYGDIPNWIKSIDHLLGQSYAFVVPGHGPVSEGAAQQRAWQKFRAYLDDFHNRLLELKAGEKTAVDIESHMKSGAYAAMGKTWMVQRNIEHFLKAGN